ncbi:UDP-N-acetylmuramoyl-tripeptide--D-alanyl-D-alanine ligase [Slackia exigua]|uniref:UDP-N-acetylmuramoyl-tripeptide--D-alanyl-D- alanine ligase n=1 Tax=Slackia exigua TaxID=84109 RepID=UPI0028E83CF5|nr:UDP-N-acetylmuramoyl-tripeptide--D-alanyl-D-alanine ligase [Slackia exigua]
MDFSIETAVRRIGARIVVEPSSPLSRVSSITWDSRAVEQGGAFLALKGARVDGHDFAGAAIAAGAALVIVTDDLPEQALAFAREAGCCIARVPDAQQALSALASAWREELSAHVVGVTGSVGKTTTRGLAAQVLSARFKTESTKGNFNNELGLPLTVLTAPKDCEALVVEMGMDGRGQIARLAAVARPERAIITNVGTAHLEYLGTRENIARAKAEIAEALPDGEGVAFLAADGEFTDFIIEHARLAERGIRVVRFGGEGHASDVYATEVAFDAEGRPTFVLHAQGESCACALKLRGAHNVQNACGAAAIGLSYGMPLPDVCHALAGAQAQAGRQALLRMPGGYRLLDDAYNASPESMAASLSVLSSFSTSGSRIAVLGDMGELGSASDAGHDSVGRAVAEAKIDALICVGPKSRRIAHAARAAGMDSARIQEVDDADAAREALSRIVRADDVVLSKASHCMGLSKLAEGAVD